MSNKLALLVNGEVVLEYDRDFVLTEKQLSYLDKMDEKMNQGIQLGSDFIDNPDTNQRCHFVADNLVQAFINDDNETLIAASMGYLATRLDDLKQVKVKQDNGEYLVDLVFDQEYKNQVKVSFPGLNS